MQELCTHSFWHAQLPQQALPPEPRLVAYVQAHAAQQRQEQHAKQLQAPPQGLAGAVGEGQGGERGGVDVLRLSCIVRGNLDRDAGSEYAAASSAGAARGDVQLHTPDAELDFEEQAQQAAESAAAAGVESLA